MTGVIVLAVFIFCGIYIQNRGKVKHDKFTRKLFDHTNFLGPINCVFYLFSAIKNTPYIDAKQFPELNILKDNWQVIRDEAVNIHQSAQIKASEDLDDLGFNSFFRTGWKRFYLKWYGNNLTSAIQLCPATVTLLDSLPNVKGAMFAMLPPGAKLTNHRDPYAGSLRYHLGLVTPNHQDCHIVVDGEKYFWKDGEAVMFDETYIHYAHNQTQQDRIILFLDVRRPVNFFLIDWFNRFFSKFVVSGSATKNILGDKVGYLNKLYFYVYQIRIIGKKIKAFNRTFYYFLQYSIYLYLLYKVFI